MPKTLKYILIAANVILSFFSWQSVDKAINVTGSSDFLFPAIYFSFFFISIYLSSIFIKEGSILQVLILVSFFVGFVFTFESWHLAAILFSIILAYIGIYKIRRDMEQNIKISLGKAVNAGKQYIIIGVAIIISCQYFLTIKDKDFQYVIPRIQSSKSFDIITSKALGMINPDFKNISEKNITVDDFIIETQKKKIEEENLSAIPEERISNTIAGRIEEFDSYEKKEEIKKETEENLKNINNKLLENNQQIILEESRKSLSQMVGKELTGQEKISDIFPQMINKKITDYFNPQMAKNTNLPLLPMVLAIILFLTIVPAGSILNIFWILVVRLIFWILVKSKVITINKVQRDIEIME